MKTLDDAWNSQDWDTFNKRHAEEVAVFWPGQPEPTRGRSNHKLESVEFFKRIQKNRNFYLLDISISKPISISLHY